MKKLRLYGIDRGMEATLGIFVQSEEHSLSAKGALKRTPEGEYQIWSVLLNNQEVFWYSVALDPNGRVTILIYPAKKRSDQTFYLAFLSKLESLGAKRLEGL
jgi:hypothetical protein